MDHMKPFEIHRKIDQSELKHNLIGQDAGNYTEKAELENEMSAAYISMCAFPPISGIKDD
ncbi:hypothetical protein JHK86_004684 [Glycine max]|nr:hypothetical protein JHK86_004684 [Glycine max]